MLFETDDKRYKPFTFRFLESTDLVHWTLLDKPIYGDKKYVGGPALYYLHEDGFFYVTYVNEFINEETRAMNYDTCIARSMDLINWEEGTRPILFPDYNHRPFPRKHPAVFEINASDAEFIEKDGKVSVFYCGGNQQGVCDNATAEFNGSLLDLFHKFFKS
jgi:alpha-L-fucosidase